MSRHKHAFLFDLDGTLVDSVYQHVLAWKESLDMEGIDLSVWRIHRKIGMSGGLFTDILLRETGTEITPERIDRLRRNHAAAYGRLAEAGAVRPLPGAVELLAWLTDAGIPWAIATSGRMETASHNIAALGVDPAKVPVVTRDQVRHAKPDPDLFVTAAERLATPWSSGTPSGTCWPPSGPGPSGSACSRADTARTNWNGREPTGSSRTRPTCSGTSTKSRREAERIQQVPLGV